MASKINYFFDYFRYLENPIECLLFKFGLKNSCIAKPKYYDEKFEINHIPAINMLMGSIGYDHIADIDGAFDFIRKSGTGKEVIEWEGTKILNQELYSFFENYNENSWARMGLDFNNRTVIDIGANVGDTALLFSKMGATVYSFEPVKEIYEIAVQNIELNNALKDKIHIFNYGVADKRGKINIREMDSTSDYANKNENYEVEIITLEDIINNYNVKPDILKMDCEGCEFGIIENCDLSDFNDIIFEHHAKIANSDYKIIPEKLESEGFKIKTYDWVGLDFKDQGIIHAYK